MPRCWETRGCDDEMQAECPHAVEFFDRCPPQCAFAACDRPTYKLTVDPALLFADDVDREAAIKDGCMFCEFFLTRGPKIKQEAG